MSLEDDLREHLNNPGDFETKFLSTPSLEDGRLAPGPEGSFEGELSGPRGGRLSIKTRHAGVQGDLSGTETTRYFQAMFRPDPDAPENAHKVAESQQAAAVAHHTRQFAMEYDTALDAHRERSPRARTVDAQKRSSRQTTDADTWKRDPRRWDFPGVDTPTK